MKTPHFKITPEGDKNGCFYEDEKQFIESLLDWLDSMEIGEELIVKKEMVEPQVFATLPEYEG